MKQTIPLLLAFALVTSSASAELMHETFDTYALGAVSNQPGWESAPTIAVVTASNPMSSPNALELFDIAAEPPGIISAGYTNFSYTYRGTNHSVIRAAFDFYRDDTNDAVGAYLELEGDQRLLLVTKNGTVRLNAIDTGTPFITGRYVHVAFYYDMSNNRAAVDYDHIRILDWTDAGGTVSTQFNTLRLARTVQGLGAGGFALFDNIVVESFPADTVVWWRFDACESNILADVTGRFEPMVQYGLGRQLEPSVSDPLYAGEDVRNPHSFRYPWTRSTTNRQGMITFSNWTVECLLRLEPGVPNSSIIDWGTGFGGSTVTNTHIGMSWNRTSTNLQFHLRDGDGDSFSTDYIHPAGRVAADDRWHHVAAVKSGNWLNVYVNYEPAYAGQLETVARDTYIFDTNSAIRCGVGLSGGNSATTQTVYDEVRLTARALSTHEFLQLGQPWIVDGECGTEAPIWDLEVVTISGKTYRLDIGYSSDGPGSWTEITNFVATSHTEQVSFDAPTGKVGYLRFLRE